MYTYLKTWLFDFREQREVERQFYTNARFRKADQALKKAYKRINPYLVSKRFLIQNGADNPYQYGETPLTTMAKIVRECELGPMDTVIEMGAGRGRAALFLAEYIGCTVLAYEQIPLFVEKMLPSKHLQMYCQDMQAAPFSEASAIFLYGTMLEDEQIQNLCQKWPSSVKIITVSYPLSDYNKEYIVENAFPGRFAWGEADIYLNRKTAGSSNE